jgi:hypothetical protein
MIFSSSKFPLRNFFVEQFRRNIFVDSSRRITSSKILIEDSHRFAPSKSYALSTTAPAQIVGPHRLPPPGVATDCATPGSDRRYHHDINSPPVQLPRTNDLSPLSAPVPRATKGMTTTIELP